MRHLYIRWRTDVMNIIKKVLPVLMIMTIITAFTPLLGDGEVYAASVKLSKKTVYMLKGKTYKLRVKGTGAKVKWKSSDTKVVTVSKKGKLKAKEYGTATVTAKVKGKTLKCKVIVERKAQKKARTLRNYILKRGKKSGSKYYISKKKTSNDNEGTTITYKITASKKNKDLTFDYSVSTEEPPEVYRASMTINLISGKNSVKSGTFKAVYEDGYSDEAWEEYYGDVTTGFHAQFVGLDDDGADGIIVKKYLSYDAGELSKEETDASELAKEDYVRPASAYLSDGFKYWDKLMAGKKTLKKAKVTMKSIGFSKF